MWPNNKQTTLYGVHNKQTTLCGLTINKLLSVAFITNKPLWSHNKQTILCGPHNEQTSLCGLHNIMRMEQNSQCLGQGGGARSILNKGMAEL